jgi:hypothetical protein
MFVEVLKNELGIAVRLPSYNAPASKFGKAAIAYVTDKTFFAKNTQLQFFKRTANGNFVLADPERVIFEVR